VPPKELYFLKEINNGMLQPEEKLEYPVSFCQHQLGKVLILDDDANVIIKDIKKLQGGQS
jgi:hypothetical protein